ncbi:MAG TPA: ABC transporter substrate-binding protein [Methylomirabilota bacterium]|jgi:peptide/nickel transport system substrate-binding protein|nr:ABC transporter substrate-binding protein [Methylomirabilota bacterium]
MRTRTAPLLMVAAVLVALTPLAATPAARPGGVLKLALLRDPTGWDPQINYGATTYSFQANIYEGLVRHSLKGTLEPGLALRWETPDPTTYVLSLRKNVRFHSGNPFTADDVKYSLERILDPNTNATRAREFGVIQAVTVTDPSTVRIALKQPTASFLELLAAGEAMMVDSQWAKAGGDVKKATSGTGPFKLGPFETGVRYTLVKNPDYWDQPLPYLDRIELASIGKDEQRVSALKTGAVDMAEYIPWQAIRDLEKDPALRVYVGYDTFNVIRLNPKRQPFDQVKVRQAFNYLVDRKEIIDLAWGGIGRPFGAGLIPEGHWAFPRQLQTTWSYDVPRAKKLLAEAGVNPAATRLVFDSTTLSVHMDEAQIIVTQLQRAGFTGIELKPMDVPTQQRKRVTGEYQMMMDGFSLPWPDPDFYTAFFGTGGASYARAVEFSDATLDKLLDQGRSALDQAKRAGIYAQVEQRLLELAPWVFLHWRPQAEASRATVGGYTRLPGALGNKSLGGLRYVYKEG